MRKSISSAVALVALLCLTCGDSGTNSRSNSPDGSVDAFAGKFHRKQPGQEIPPANTPNTPANVSGAAASSNSITISWPLVSGAAGYRIYRSTSSSGSYTHIGTTSYTSYTDDGLSANTTYYYKVLAYNDAGDSSQSSYASVTTKNGTDIPTPTAPDIPLGVTASASSSSSITVSWNSVSGATGYYVYRGTSSTGSYTQLGTSTTTSYMNSGLSASTTYYYKVSAYNSAGESSVSSYASATTTSNITIPGVPSSVTASASSSSGITVSWSSVSGATGYYVYRSTSSAGSYTQLGTSTSTSYTNTGLSASTTYYYKVSAYNSAGESSMSSYASATTDAVVIVGGNNCTSAATCKTVTIGNQTWMAENLNIVMDNSYCYGNSSESCAKYGRLYIWEAAKTACPSGWHLPTNAEWQVLVLETGGSSVAGKALKSTSGWNNNGNGTDTYGFSALPSGILYSDGGFYDAGNEGSWWTATEFGAKYAYHRSMFHDYYEDYVHENSNLKNNAFSVRCLRDD